MQKIDLTGKTVFVTGGIGFIGADLILTLLREVEPITIVSAEIRRMV